MTVFSDTERPTGSFESASASEIPRQVSGLALLRGLEPRVRELVEDAFLRVNYPFGAVIVRQGEEADALYVIVEGSARVLTVSESGEEVPLSVLGAGDVFGEISLLSGGVRTATVRARTPVVALRLDRGLFLALVQRRPELRLQLEGQRERTAITDFLALETGFRALPGPDRTALADAVAVRTSVAGAGVIAEGDPPGPMYVVRDGRLAISAGADGPMGFLRSGDLFGERSLLHSRPRAATVTAVSECVLLELGPQQFERLVAAHPEVGELVDLLATRAAGPTRHVPLDFSKELLPAAAHQQVGPGPDVESPPEEMPASTPAASGRRALRGFPFVRQIDLADCGAACLAMVCRHYGRRLSLTRIRAAAATSIDGTSLRGLLCGAQELGLNANAVTVSPSRLAELPLPAIAHWEHNHWVVLYAVDERFVRVANPATGLRRLTRAEAEEKITGYAMTVAPGEEFSSLPDQTTSAGWLLEFLRPAARQLVLAAVLALLAAGLEMLIPVGTGQIVDHALPSHDRARVNLLALGLLGILASTVLAMMVQRVLLARVAARIDQSLLDFLTGRLLALPMSYFNSRRTGDIERRLNSVALIRQYLVQYGVIAVTAAAQVGVALILMLLYNGVLTLLYLAVMPLYAGLLWFSRNRLRPAYDELEEAFGKYQSRQVDALKGIESVKAIGGEDKLRRLISSQFGAVRSRVYRADLASMLFEGSITTLGFLSLGTFVWVGSLEVMAGHLTLGGLVGFNSLVLLANAPLATLLRVWDQFQYAGVLIGRMNDVVEPEPEQGSDRSALTGVPSVSGRVSIRGVHLAFPAALDHPVLKDISLDVPPGTKVAIVGRSGSGKTTLVRLLAGLLEPTGGAILYDGIDMRTLDWRQLRRHLGFVLQDSYLFDDTIARNIAFGERQPDLSRVIDAARVAAAHGFIERLPFGYETKVGESGLLLSGGQRQRIAIARAVYHRPPILILDEATSALDTESERAVKEQLGELLADRTSFTIAHRLSTVRDADVIIVMDAGAIVERGTHDELIARRGLYYHLAAQQVGL
jgi:ATP-binding cassette subfamily B protein